MYTDNLKGWRLLPVLSGWFRLQHTTTGATMDFNPNDEGHMTLYAHYENNSNWHIVDDKRPPVQPLSGDEDTEPFYPITD